MTQELSLSEQITKKWEKDSKLDRYNITVESTKIPNLHSTYIDYYRKIKTNINKIERKIEKLRLEKFHFYSGKADPEVYRKNKFNHKVLKSDMDYYINADQDYSTLKEKLDEYKIALDVTSSILDQIKTRNFVIKNIIEWEKFTAGS